MSAAPNSRLEQDASPALMAVRSSVLLAVVEIVKLNSDSLLGDWWKGAPCRHVGALTTQISRHIGASLEKTRRELNKLQLAGCLESHKTAGGITRWYPANGRVSESARENPHA